MILLKIDKVILRDFLAFYFLTIERMYQIRELRMEQPVSSGL